MVQYMDELLVAGTEGIPLPDFPIGRVSSRPAREILSELGIKRVRVFAHWNHENRGVAEMADYGGFPWEKARLESLTEEEIVRSLDGNLGLGLSAKVAKGEYELELLPPRLYGGNLAETLPRLPETIQARITHVLQNKSMYIKPVGAPI